jgi:CheY-like chemotaxis protein
MRILLADDDPDCCLVTSRALRSWGFEVEIARDGAEALELLRRRDGPLLAILDWRMPRLDGPDVCRQVRADPALRGKFLILLTGLSGSENLVEGLEAGANDFVTKQFALDELRARVQVGRRVVELQQQLEQRVRDLEGALAQVRRLQGLLPICSYCKRVRDDREYWREVEHYIADHADVRFSHGVCPDCFKGKVQPMLAEFRARHAGESAPAGTTPS